MANKKNFTAAAQFFQAEGQARPEQEQQQKPAAAQTDGRPAFTPEERRRRAAANAAYVSQRKSAPRERPDYFEARSKRVNLLLKPSVYEAGLVLADDMAISFNHLMELAIIEYTERHLQIDDDEQEQ